VAGGVTRRIVDAVAPGLIPSNVPRITLAVHPDGTEGVRRKSDG